MASAAPKRKFGKTKAAADPTKKLVIQTRTVERLVKELRGYFKEVDENRAKIEKMRMEGADEYDIKKYGEVLDESEMMVPDTQRRLKQFTRQLRETVEDVEEEAGVAGTEALTKAKAILAEVAAGIKPEEAGAPAAAAPSPAAAAAAPVAAGAAAGGSGDGSAADPAAAAPAAAPVAAAPAAADAEDEIGEDEM